jgi:hypothetical protein
VHHANIEQEEERRHQHAAQAKEKARSPIKQRLDQADP